MPKHVLTPIRVRFQRLIGPPDQNGCIIWKGTTEAGGYGQIGRGRRGSGMVRAHRLAWEFANGPIPDGLCVLHKCDVRRCVNPEHLFLGTKKDNAQDMLRKGRARHVPHLGEDNGTAKLTEQDVQKVRKRHGNGETHVAIAASLGVRPTAIWSIVHGKSWKHV